VTADTAVVIAVRDVSSAKSRLSEQLDPGARRSLVIAMLDDLLSALRQAHTGPILVVSPDAAYGPVATTHAATLVADPGDGLNAAFGAALQEARAQGATAALLLPGDLPHVSAEDLALVLEAANRPGVALVPASDGGTIALALRPLDVIAPRFGERSAARHRAAARAAEATLVELSPPSMRIDIDTLADLDRVSSELGEATTALLEHLPIGSPVEDQP
jgi:2-phospho-L-lactate guanylyltransferase